MRALASSALVLAACGGASPPPEPGPPPAPRAVVVAPSPAVVEEPKPPPLPAEVSSPPKVACAIPGERLDSYAPLRLAVGGPAYAWVWGGKARLEVALGDPGGSLLAVERNGVSLRGKTSPRGKARGRRRGLDLFPREPVVFEALAVARPAAELAWESAAEGALRVRLDVGAPVQGRPSLRADVSCDKLGLAPSKFDPRAALAVGAPKREVSLVPNRRVPLAAAPGGVAVFELFEPATTDESLASDDVEVHDTVGAHAKVVVPAENALLFGWVSSKALHKPAERAGVLGSLGGEGGGLFGAVGGNVKRTATLLACPHALTLVARVGAEEARVGSVAPGTTVEVVSETEGGKVVRPLASGWMRLDEGARLVVPSSETKGCEVSRAAVEEEPEPFEADFGLGGIGIGDD